MKAIKQGYKGKSPNNKQPNLSPDYLGSGEIDIAGKTDMFNTDVARVKIRKGRKPGMKPSTKPPSLSSKTMTATYAKFTLQLNTVTDADVIEYLSAQANKNDTIRRALRAQASLPVWAQGLELSALLSTSVYG